MGNMGEKIRAFIAISLPESVLQAMGQAQQTLGRLGRGIRWVRKEGIHLTLKFLGDVDRDDVERIQIAMERATEEASPFVLTGQGTGVFPDLRRPRVIWMGLSGDLQRLFAHQANLETLLDDLGFPKDKRPFKGHLTLGRVKGHLDATELREALEGLAGFQTDAFTVQSVALFQSTLRPHGAVYTKLAEVPLGSA
jgi:2'-5' RNA ligase